MVFLTRTHNLTILSNYSTHEGGFKCYTVWCISLSAIGLVFSIISAGFWAWTTAIIAIALFGAVGCTPLTTARILAAIAAPFAFLTFILQVSVSSIILSSGSIYCATPTYVSTNDYYYGGYTYYTDDYYDRCNAVSIALGSIGIIASLIWLAAAIIGAVLAYKMSVALGDNCCGDGAGSLNKNQQHVAGTKVAEPDIEVANAVPISGSSSVRVVEKINADGTKVIEKTMTDASGNETVMVSTIGADESEEV